MRALCLTIAVVKFELTVLNVLSDSIDLDLGVVDVDARIGTGDNIDLSTAGLLLEEWSLADTDTDPHL